MLPLIGMVGLAVAGFISARAPNAWFRKNYKTVLAETGVTFGRAYWLCIRLLISPRGDWLQTLGEPIRQVVIECGRTWPKSRSPMFYFLRTFVVGVIVVFALAITESIFLTYWPAN